MITVTEEISGAETLGPIPSGKKRILIIDDDKNVARLVARILTMDDEYEATIVSEPGVGLVKARQHRYDAIVSDIVMPAMDGVELIRAIRVFDLDIPIILMTGTPSIETAQKALEFGAFRYLKKPLDPNELQDVVKQAVFASRISQLKRQAFQLSGVEDLRPGDLAGMTEAFGCALETLRMVYQPIVRAKDGSLFGYEALMRSGDARLPFPTSILKVAEHLNRLFDVGRKVRDIAIGPMADVPEEIKLFLNLHPRDLLDGQLGASGSPLVEMAHRVVLEITERESLDRVPQVQEKLDRLREMGFEIAVDDMGAGYAGLSCFASLQPSIIKLDMSLIFDIHSSSIKRRVVESMVEACHDLNILVVAEGVETENELTACREIGCDLLQGYFIAKPASPFPAINWI